VRFQLWAKGLSAKDINQECFLFTVGSVCRVKRFSLADEEVGTAVGEVTETSVRRVSADW
jgi:hypothetical protein